MKNLLLLFIILIFSSGSVIASNCCTCTKSCSYNINLQTKPTFCEYISYMPKKKCRYYTFDYDGTTYYMMKTNSNDSYTYQSFVGCGDLPRTYAEPLIDITQTKSLIIYPRDLNRYGIRFVKQNSDGTLDLLDKSNDFPITRINKIDLGTITYTLGSKNRGKVKMTVTQDSKSKSLTKVLLYMTTTSIEETNNLINKSLNRIKQKQFYNSGEL